MKELLDTDRTNFLIWRYLLESGYRETAAKLQKEWNIQKPHRHFPFAPHVKDRALVATLNKGLCLLDLERAFRASKLPEDVREVAGALQSGVFGPLIPQPPREDEDEDDDGDDGDDQEDDEISGDEAENPRKRTGALAHGSPAKRPRLSNGYDHGADAATTPMEIDHHSDNNHAYPSPQEGEQLASPAPRTDGPEQSTQIEKVDELLQETTFLHLASEDEPGAASPLGLEANQNPIVLHCEWSPRNPSVLAAAGTDALARIWTVSRAPAADAPLNHVNGVNRPYRDLIRPDMTRDTTVTALAWSGDGDMIAIATASGPKAQVNTWSPDGTHLSRFEVAEPPIIKLCWSPNSALLLGIAPENGGTLITIFSPSATTSYALKDHDLSLYPLDAAWTGETEFLLCGGSMLTPFRCSDTGIVAGEPLTAQAEDDKFSQIQFDHRSKLVAAATEKGVIHLWDENRKHRSISAHIDTVTALQWQPVQSRSSAFDDEILLASGGEDGMIFIWNVRSGDSKPKCSMTVDQPVVAMSFTPDGAFIAGATSLKVLIWKIGENSTPRASWTRPTDPGWLSPRVGSDQDEEDTHCLGWDSNGQKLAYGANSRLAVINFR